MKRLLCCLVSFLLILNPLASVFADPVGVSAYNADVSEEAEGASVDSGIAVIVSASNGNTAELTVEGDVSAVSENNSVSAVYIYASGENSEVSLNVDGDVKATSENSNASGVTEYAFRGGETSIDINGDLTVAGDGNITGARIQTDEDSKASFDADNVKVSGDSVIGIETYGSGEMNVDISGGVVVEANNTDGSSRTYGIEANGDSTVTVVGTVEVTSTVVNNQEGKNLSNQVTGVQATEDADVTVGGFDVSADSTGVSYTSAYGIRNDYSGPIGDVTVKGDVSVDVNTVNGSGSGYGIYVYDHSSSSSSNEEESEDEKKTSGSISVGGAIEVTTKSSTSTSSSTGVYVYSSNSEESTSEISITGDITSAAITEKDSSRASGISVSSTENGEITVIVTGNVSADAKAEAAEKTYKETHQQYPYHGNTEATDYTGYAHVTVNGDVSANAESSSLRADATGITARANGNNPGSEDAEEEETGDEEPRMVESTYVRSADASGVSASGINAEVIINGSVEVTAKSDEGYAEGIYATSSNEGKSVVDVSQNVIVKADDGIDAEAIYAVVYGSGEIDISVGKNVESTDTGIEVRSSSDATGKINIEVDGDVKADNYGLEVNMYGDQAVAEIIVAGTLSGEESSIVVSDDTTPDNVKLTVWKVDLTEVEGEKHAVTEEEFVSYDSEKKEWEVEQTVTETSKAVEENIRYIIKIEPNENGQLSVEGTEKVDDYDTAKEGSNVIFKITPNEGYHVVAAYNGEGQEVPLVKDENGNYYVIVPRGGGVYLSAVIEGGKEAAESSEEEKTENLQYFSFQQIAAVAETKTYTDDYQKLAATPKKIEEARYFDLLTRAYMKNVNPLTNADYVEINQGLRYIYKEAGISEEKANWIIEALSEADQEERMLYLFSLYNYKIDGRYNGKKSQFLGTDNTLYMRRQENETTNKKSYLELFFHETGHAIMNNLIDWSITSDYESLIESTPMHMYSVSEKDIQNQLQQDVKNIFTDAITINENDGSTMYKWIDYLLNYLEQEGKIKADKKAEIIAYKDAPVYDEEQQMVENDDPRYIARLNEAIRMINTACGTNYPENMQFDESIKTLVVNTLVSKTSPQKTFFGDLKIPNEVQKNQIASFLYNTLATTYISITDATGVLESNACMIRDALGGFTNHKWIIDGHTDKNYWYYKEQETYNQVFEAWAEYFSSKIGKDMKYDKNRKYFEDSCILMDQYEEELLTYYAVENGAIKFSGGEYDTSILIR